VTKVKVCGLTCREDVEIVNALKPDYAGFVFAPGRHYLNDDRAKDLCAMLDGSIQKVGVFVNEEKNRIEEIIKKSGLDAVQLHGDERPEDCGFESCEVWKAFRIRQKGDLMRLNDYRVDRFLLDAYAAGAYGGTGKRFEWSLLDGFNGKENIILAGGLSPDNVKAAIAAVSPYAVDVSSGVETNGRKDYGKVKEFIDKAGKRL